MIMKKVQHLNVKDIKYPCYCIVSKTEICIIYSDIEDDIMTVKIENNKLTVIHKNVYDDNNLFRFGRVTTKNYFYSILERLKFDVRVDSLIKFRKTSYYD